MLLTILEEQAMDSLLLGSDKQNDFMQSILHTMKRQSEGKTLTSLSAFECSDGGALLKYWCHCKNCVYSVEKKHFMV